MSQSKLFGVWGCEDECGITPRRAAIAIRTSVLYDAGRALTTGQTRNVREVRQDGALMALYPTPAVASHHRNLSATVEETRSEDREAEDEVVESPAVRAELMDVFRARSFRNGVYPLQELLREWKARQRSIPCSRSRLEQMIGRTNSLAVIGDDLVVWIGDPVESFLIQRLRQVIMARRSPLSVEGVLIQVRRGNDRLDLLVERHLRDLVAIHPAFELRGNGVAASEKFSEVFEGSLTCGLDVIEFRIFEFLRKTTLSKSVNEIATKLRKKPEALASILATSAVICDAEPGRYRTVRNFVHQLSMFA
jgi:hypothetical protein